MAMGRRTDRARTPGLWIAANELPTPGGHPFYQRLNQVLDAHGFDAFVESQCAPFYADGVGRPSLTPGTYVRLLLIGYFEGIDSERGAVYANRRRSRGARGRRLQRRRSEYLERPNAHLYETGGMRRTHRRGHANILKRLLARVGGFNLGLLMRTVFGGGTPRSLQGSWRFCSGLWWHSGAPSTTSGARETRGSPITRPCSPRIAISNCHPSRRQHAVFNHGLLAVAVLTTQVLAHGDWFPIAALHRVATTHRSDFTVWENLDG